MFLSSPFRRRTGEGLARPVLVELIRRGESVPGAIATGSRGATGLTSIAVDPVAIAPGIYCSVLRPTSQEGEGFEKTRP